jgi:hypothetical protein
MANPGGESIRKYLAIYAHFIAINVMPESFDRNPAESLLSQACAVAFFS